MTARRLDSSMTTSATVVDISVQNEGTIVVLHAASTAAMEWLDENLAHAARWGNGYVVEHRYADAVISGAQADGLAVG